MVLIVPIVLAKVGDLACILCVKEHDACFRFKAALLKVEALADLNFKRVSRLLFRQSIVDAASRRRNSRHQSDGGEKLTHIQSPVMMITRNQTNAMNAMIPSINSSSRDGR